MNRLVLIIAMFVSACSQSPTVQTGAGAQKNSDGLSTVSHSGFDKASVVSKDKLSQFKSYFFEPLDLSAIDIKDPELASGFDSKWDFTEKDSQQWQEYYDKAIKDTMTKYLPVADAPGPGVAIVKSKVTRFAPSAPKYDSIDRGVRNDFYSKTSGNLTLVTEIFDSSNTLVANIEDRRDIGSDVRMNENTIGQFAMDLKNTFSRWARNFGTNLKKIAE